MYNIGCRKRIGVILLITFIIAASILVPKCAYRDTDVKLAIIDGGISERVSFDSSKYYINEAEVDNGIDDDSNGYIDDIFGWDFRDEDRNVFESDGSGHGTSVAFLLNGEAPDYHSLLEECKCLIIPIKILSIDERARMSDLIEAIEYAEMRGAAICNLSIASYADNDELYNTIKKSKMLFVVAAGNDGVKIDDKNPVFPAMYNLDNVITVASMGGNGNVSKFTNYGREYVDVIAPGENIYLQNCEGEWEAFSGTTYSAAWVSAIAVKYAISENCTKAKRIKEGIIRGAAYHNKYKKYVKYGSVE